MEYDKLLHLLSENCTEAYKQFNAKIVNSGVPLLGCRVPFLRSVVEKYPMSADEALALPTHRLFELDMLKGMYVAAAKLPFAEKSSRLTAFASTIENWAVCDCCTVKISTTERPMWFAYFASLCKSSKPFVCRYGIVNMIASFLDEAHIDSVFSLLAEINAQDYYVDMAKAWLVSTAMAKCRNQTVAFMEGAGRTVLNSFAYNTALQKMRDSFRVSATDKAWSRTLKM